ncbi:restriction endonuclease subunit S [Accumulibacter sp.]|uniref:restriction endonuclease subunit S n=1 Tax=Accumulibacter sp. TaxID=2053492 RepID=UPI0025D130EC|nr:restriction endonuclease subunit S [Accumulibacter sp.]MCP5230217.1 restriction endonuclease subunit S [Accumulibacter sp.]
MTPVIPVGPEARRLRFLFETRSGATPSSGVEEYWDGDINWVTPEDLGKLGDRYVRETRRRITEEGYKNSAVNLALPGSIVLSKRAPIGQTAILAEPSTCNQGCFLLTRVDGVDERFYYYALIYLRPALEALGRGSTFMELSADDLRSVRMPFPSEVDQQLIADYLDGETARIDRLIAEKERMLALLEEKGAALISRVVTRGLDTNAPLKPSGQEWLGEIPTHWVIQPIKYLAVVGNGSTPSVENADYWDDEGYPWLNSSVVNVSPVTDASRFVTEAALRECHLPKIHPPAVLVGITGQGKTRGMAAMLGIEATINQHVAFIKPRTQELDTEYLRYLLLHAYAFLRSDSDGAGSTKGAITCEQLANMKIPVPPSSEQIDICGRIRQSLEVSKPLRAEIQRSLDLLTERRSALITAAVTGQFPLKEMNG